MGNSFFLMAKLPRKKNCLPLCTKLIFWLPGKICRMDILTANILRITIIFLSSTSNSDMNGRFILHFDGHFSQKQEIFSVALISPHWCDCLWINKLRKVNEACKALRNLFWYSMTQPPEIVRFQGLFSYLSTHFFEQLKY